MSSPFLSAENSENYFPSFQRVILESPNLNRLFGLANWISLTRSKSQ